MVLVLFENASGYSLFNVKDSSRTVSAPLPPRTRARAAHSHSAQLSLDPEALSVSFASDPKAYVSLVAFDKFANVPDATAAATALVEGSLDKSLSKFLKANLKGVDSILVSDSKLGAAIKSKLSVECIAPSTTGVDAKAELLRGIRENLSSLVPGLDETNARQMALGLAHQLSRYKLRFSPDKVDTMIVQAIGLLDELDKEVNTYAMRVREWYGWHFPEMAKIVSDGVQYAKIAQRAGLRVNMRDLDLSDILGDEDVERALKEQALVSMGTDVSEDDLAHITELCEQVVSLSAYRAQLSDYLRNRMNAIAPNLTVMVGELVGARLIAHAGSLLNLAKAPASTVQILGAEKALFRALKTKHDTPKYGLIYHASLIGQAAQKNKGKIARVLAAKCSLAIRVDALGDGDEATVAIECRQKVEARLRQLETGEAYRIEPAAAAAVAAASSSKKKKKANGGVYNEAGDATRASAGKKRSADEFEGAAAAGDGGGGGDGGDDEKARRKAEKKAAKKAKKAAEAAGER